MTSVCLFFYSITFLALGPSPLTSFFPSFRSTFPMPNPLLPTSFVMSVPSAWNSPPQTSHASQLHVIEMSPPKTVFPDHFPLAFIHHHNLSRAHCQALLGPAMERRAIEQAPGGAHIPVETGREQTDNICARKLQRQTGLLQRDEASGEKRALRLGLDHVVRGPLRR